MKFALLLILSSLALGVSGQYSFSLEEAIEYGLRENIDAKNARLDQLSRKRRAFEVVTTGFPKLNTTLAYTHTLKFPTIFFPDFADPNTNPSDLGSATLVPTEAFGFDHKMELGAEVSQLLFDGRYLIGLKAKNEIVNVGTYQYQLTEIDVKEKITKAYYAVLIAENNEALLVNSANSLDQIYNETKALFTEGFVEQLDVERLELQTARLNAQIENVAMQKQNAANYLKFLLNVPIETEIELSDALSKFTDGLVFNLARGSFDPAIRTEFQLLETQLKLRKYDLAQQRASYIPSVYGFFSYGTVAERNEFNFWNRDRWYPFGYTGVSLNWNIFDGLTNYAKIQQTKLNLEQIKNNKELFVQSAKLEVQNARNAYQNAINNYNNSQRNLDLAEEIYRKTNIKYIEGVGSSLELSTADSDRSQARIEFMQAQHNLLTSKTDLEKALGDL